MEEATVVAGESLPRFLLPRDLVDVLTLSSMSVLKLVSRAQLVETSPPPPPPPFPSSASSDLMMLALLPRANAEIVLAACRVERRTRFGETALLLKILVVSCDTLDVLILIIWPLQGTGTEYRSPVAVFNSLREVTELTLEILIAPRRRLDPGLGAEA
jgi:hypothetical protein